MVTHVTAALLLSACAGAPPEPATTPSDPLAALTRLSLDLRGVRPSTAELEAVAADAQALDPLRAAFFEDPRLAEQVVAGFAEVWNTVRDETEHPASALGLEDEPGFARAVGEEPLRILAEVAMQDLPWTEIVTADWTRVDAQLALVWPVELLEEPAADGWRRARYTDGRPAAGALVSNGLWWRYETSENNASRGRANQLSRILLCRDFTLDLVAFDRSLDLSDEEAVRAALHNNPGCAGCHSTLDPLASLLGGVYVTRKSGVEELLRYHPEREGIWRTQTGVPPSYFGLPAEALGDLGQRIAADPNFIDCAVQQSAELLLRRPLTLEDTDKRTAWREQFLDSGLTLRSLWEAIVRSEEYEEGAKLLTPALLSSMIEDLTGFRLLVDGADLLRTSTYGLATLAGAGDGEFATGVAQDWSATLVLVQNRVAEAAADHAVRVEPSRLLAVDPTAELDYDALREAIAALHLRVLSRAAAESELEALSTHHAEVARLSGSEAAWVSVLTVLLRDPELLVY